ncbi:MraY-like glycosyltransferase [Crateriforma conspicua]|uniref:MraY-like glycosyltransferase n=2 Tax=Crateriforma conspicua TaxID=2527996 RepID=A0A5C5YDV0_9PLAN|nr:MraY-like glycosyltransferase [Crateriforma conspicua]TWT72621.1 MraY-like glycosyltransferase [Crateriforma conspicua]
MTMTHEFGHIVGGMACGATLTDFDLAPWRMPYSLHSPDPHPLVTLWAGPLLGVAVPFIGAALVRKRWAWFIADFCLIANGGYLALAWLSGDRFLDTPRLLAAGAHPGSIVVYCMVTIGVGYVWFRSDCIHFLAPQPSGGEPCRAPERRQRVS